MNKIYSFSILLILSFSFTLSSCVKNLRDESLGSLQATNDQQAKTNEQNSKKKSKLSSPAVSREAGSDAGFTPIALNANGAYTADISGTTLTFTDITYRTGAVDGEAVYAYSVSSSLGSVGTVGPNIIVYYTSYGTPNTNLYDDISKYETAWNNFINSGGSMPVVGNYIQPVYGSGQTRVFRGVVIKSNNYSSGFAIAPYDFTPIDPNQGVLPTLLPGFEYNGNLYYLTGRNGQIIDVDHYDPITQQSSKVFAFDGTYWENGSGYSTNLRIYNSSNMYDYFDYNGVLDK